MRPCATRVWMSECEGAAAYILLGFPGQRKRHLSSISVRINASVQREKTFVFAIFPRRIFRGRVAPRFRSVDSVYYSPSSSSSCHPSSGFDVFALAAIAECFAVHRSADRMPLRSHLFALPPFCASILEPNLEDCDKNVVTDS